MTISIFSILNLFSTISFLGFGLACLKTEAMRLEFQRYRLPQYRQITGVLQLLGAIGLLFGPYVPFVGLAAALGLSLQMFAGMVVRIHIRDTVLQTLPATLYCILNAVLTWMYFVRSEA